MGSLRKLLGLSLVIGGLVGNFGVLRAESTLYRLNYPGELALLGGLYLTSEFTPTLLPIKAQPLKATQEFFAFDEGVKHNFSLSAAHKSDELALLTAFAPIFMQLGHNGVTEQFWQFNIIYAETLLVNDLLSSFVKFMAQRQRPYSHNPAPEVQEYTKHQGKDPFLSFYSGHASSAFAAAVAGAYMFGRTSPDIAARSVFWGVELALSTAIANLRVRSGKHYYTDVVAGALVGTALGLVIPRLHQPAGQDYHLDKAEIWAMGGGILVGILGSQFLLSASTELPPLPKAASKQTLRVLPTLSSEMAGLAVVGNF